MTKAIPGAIRQAVSGKGMYIGILSATVVLLLSTVQDVLLAFRSEELLQNGFHHTCVMNALASDAMTLALPIIAALPFTSSFIDDIKSGFVKEYLPRTTKSDYLLGKSSAASFRAGFRYPSGCCWGIWLPRSSSPPWKRRWNPARLPGPILKS